MPLTRLAAGAATALLGLAGAALGVSGCSSHDQVSQTQLTLVQPTAAAPTADPGPLPAPEALADVLYRLADPAVPGPAKLPLVQNATPADAAAADRFATAMRDTGFVPVTVTATGLRWSPAQPGDVVATVKIAAPDRGGEFTFPMEFARNGDGWQLTRETAAMLLAFGNARTEALPPPG